MLQIIFLISELRRAKKLLNKYLIVSFRMLNFYFYLKIICQDLLLKLDFARTSCMRKSVNSSRSLIVVYQVSTKKSEIALNRNLSNDSLIAILMSLIDPTRVQCSAFLMFHHLPIVLQGGGFRYLSIA